MTAADQIIVIIDGEFGQNLSVSPKEILRLLDQGVRVIGASSMGALRAAELQRFGMEGLGWIYDSFASGRLTRDDEVALTYSPIDSSPVTVPLVNVRYWLESLEKAGELDKATTLRMLRKAGQIFFGDRTFQVLRKELEAVVGKERFEYLLQTTGGVITDIKSCDACFALTRVSQAIKECSERRLFNG
ncbi:MAG: TfuA-like protein [Acidobacteriota bacterium]